MKSLLIRSLLLLTLLASTLLADPPDTWYRRNPLPTPFELRGVAFGQGLFVAMGDDIATSTNGLEWTAKQTLLRESLFGIAYGQGVFVSVGVINPRDPDSYPTAPLGTILTSTNGVDWTPRLVTTNAHLRCVAYGDGTFVAAGWGKSVMVSTDGLNWTQHDLATEQTIERIAFANGKFVAVGHGVWGTILTSADGTNWTQTYSVENDACYGVTFGSGLFVATSYRGNAITSPDGISWTARPTVAGYELTGIAYGNGLFVAGTGTAALLTSTNGRNWTAQAQGPGVSINLSFHNGMFIDPYGLRSSIDGSIWSTPNTGSKHDHFRVIYAKGRFVAVGKRESILTSSNGVAWIESRGGGTNWLWDITYGNGLFVTVGESGALLTSTDSFVWTARPSLNIGETFSSAVGFGNGLFVASTFTGEVWTSTDGVDWLKTAELATAWPWAIAYGEGLFAVVGAGGEIWTSNDGSHWTLRGSTGEYLRSIVHANGVFVAVGGMIDQTTQAPIITSNDGTNWVSRSSGVRGALETVTFGDDMFVAIGNVTVTTSKNGTDWFGRRAFVGGTGVAYGNNTFVSVSLRTIFQSDPIVRLGFSSDALLSISAMVDHRYRIDATSDLGFASTWLPLGTIFLTNSPSLWRDNSVSHPDRRLYRAVLVP